MMFKSLIAKPGFNRPSVNAFLEMLNPFRSGLFRQFSTTVVDQVLLSGANFLIGFLLIRKTSDLDYGLFVLVQSAITLVISAQGAWLSSPLAVVAPAKPAAIKRLMIGAVEFTQRRFLRRVVALALIATPAGYFLHFWSPLETLVMALGIIACWTALQREYLRGVLLIYSRPQSMLRADMIYVGVLVTGALIAAFGPKPAVVTATVTLVVSALAGEAAARHSLAKHPGLERGDSAEFFREMRPLAVWATIGAMTYWIYNQSYNYVLASRINLVAVADVNAARLLLMPTIVLTVGIKTLLVPTAAGWLAQTSIGRLIRRLLWFATGIALIDLVYCAAVWFLRDWLSHDLMHKTIGDRDRLLMLWAALSFIALYRDLLQTGLFALRRFKSLAAVTAASAIVSLSIMSYGIQFWGAAAALIGQVAGECVNLGGVIFLLGMAHYHAIRRATPPVPSEV